MAAGGRADDADAFGVELPLVGAGAHRADCAGRVLQHDRMPIAVRAEPVLQDERRDAVFVEPNCVARALVRRECAVTAAGTNHHRGARGLARLREERRQRRDIVGALAQRAGRVAGPKRKGVGRLRLGERQRNREGEERKWAFHGAGG